MNQKIMRILAIVALVFMIIFAISATMYFYNTQMFGGVLQFVLYISGALGIGIGVPLIIMNNGLKKQAAKLKRYEDARIAEEQRLAAEAAEAEAKRNERIELDKKINKENSKK